MKYPQVEHADLSKPHYQAWAHTLRSGEGNTDDEMRRLERVNVGLALRRAYENTPGYRALYDAAGVHPTDFHTLDDLRRFPTVDKATLRADLEAFSVRMKGREYTTTGGSTGEPFGFYRDPWSFARELASKAHQYHRIGWREGDRELVLRGLVIDSPDHVEFIPRFNALRCSVYHLTPEWMEFYYRRVLEYRPEWIRCLPSAGYTFARWLRETGREFPQCKGILCASENLYDYQKELLAEVFGGRVFDHYGLHESVVLAGYCEYEDTYHVLPQYGYAELLDENDEPVTERGQTGEIVGTSFVMFATPFVRYRTGDFATFQGWGCEACRRPHQIWSDVVGREQECIVTVDGRRISMAAAINFHDDTLAGVREFQFRQRERGRVEFVYVARGEPDGKRIASRLAAKLGDGFELSLREVEDIPRTRRGKRLLVV